MQAGGPQDEVMLAEWKEMTGQCNIATFTTERSLGSKKVQKAPVYDHMPISRVTWSPSNAALEVKPWALGSQASLSSIQDK